GRLRFGEDAVRVAGSVATVLTRRLAASQDLFDEFDGAASPTAQLRALENAAKALLGEDFKIIPEFTLPSALAAEIDNALTASRSGTLFTFLTNPPDPATMPLDFPVDTWLHGLARVREKMFAWEQIVMMAGALGSPEPQLDPLQLPFAPNDRWLGLEFPAESTLNNDRLLYTAHFSTAFSASAGQCGLLIDEWTEVIPGSTADTGITFHHDRPNCEAPQAMLLVTPADFTGFWQWNDVVDALNETLNFAKRRAIEPRHVDSSPYAPFLPATILETQVIQLTIALELGLNNKIVRALD